MRAWIYQDPHHLKDRPRECVAFRWMDRPCRQAALQKLRTWKSGQKSCRKAAT